jgi:PTS system cellobiose-specific IIA component
MAEMEGSELTAFNIIAAVGTARSCYISAIDAAAEGRFDEAGKLMKEGKDAYDQGHQSHAVLLTDTARGEKMEMDLLLTHAEDQLMSAEAFGILAERFITLYHKLYDEKKKPEEP